MIRQFARHPNAANLLMAAIIVLGIAALPLLRRATFPEIDPDKAQITVLYPGAAPEEAADALCRPLEEAIEGVLNLDEFLCEAREGRAIATAVMREGGDMGRFLDDVKAEVAVIDDFPELAEEPVVRELGRTEAVIALAVTGPEEPTALKDYAEALKSRLMAVEGVAQATIGGFSQRQIRVAVDPGRLRALGLSAADVGAALARRNLSTPAGRLEGGSEEFLIRFDDQRKTVERLEELVVVEGASGAAVRLGEIAELTDLFESPEEMVWFNGRRAALITIERNRNQDILRTLDGVRAFVERERADAPRGVSLILTQDRGSVVRDRLELLAANGLQGLALVFAILWLFFSFRFSFWVAMGLPVSFLGALFVLFHLGMTINMITMVGLLIGVGLLMDDAIVISENVAHRLQRGAPPLEAAVEGTREVALGILSSFATTVLIFGSLAFLSGEMGQVLRVMPVVLIVVLAVSLLEAFLILPNHLHHALGPMARPEPGRFRAAFERGFARLRDRGIGPALAWAVRRRYLTAGLAVLIVLAAIAFPAGGLLKFRAFPDLDGDVIEARLLLPQGTPLARTEAVVQRLTAALDAVNAHYRPLQPDGEELVRNVAVIYSDNPDAYESGPHVARVSADLLGAETRRQAAVDDVLNRWRAETGALADVIAIKYTEPTMGPAGRAIDIRLHGADLPGLKAASEALQGWLNRFRGVADLGDDLRPGKREFRLRMRPGAGPLGFDAQRVSEQLRAAFQGVAVDEFQRGPESFELQVRLRPEARMDADDLENFHLVGDGGALIPLGAAVQIEERRGWSRLHRIDGRPTVTIQGEVDARQANVQQIIAEMQAAFLPGFLERHPGVSVSIQGESKRAGETGGSLRRNLLLGLIGVYMLLALQFRGYLAPLIVMAVIPTALFGVMVGHWALGIDLSMPSVVGAASLFGVVVNDSILLAQFIESGQKRGMATTQAAIEAGVQRFRPILLTSLTTVAGLTPLLLEKSLQAQILIPLAASLAFGLTAGTLIALFLVPALYCIFDDFGWMPAIGESSDADPPGSGEGSVRPDGGGR